MSVTRLFSRYPLRRPLASKVIASAASTCADRMRIAVSGNSSRIVPAASSPSVE